MALNPKVVCRRFAPILPLLLYPLAGSLDFCDCWQIIVCVPMLMKPHLPFTVYSVKYKRLCLNQGVAYLSAQAPHEKRKCKPETWWKGAYSFVACLESFDHRP
ncbi:unnamed protein product, partial [Sphacelaria rigidula]